MKSDRTPAKAPPPPSALPYGTLADARQRHGVSLLSRVVRHLGTTVAKLIPRRQYASAPRGTAAPSCSVTSVDEEQGVAAPALQPGDVLRDVPFPTHKSEVAYFSTHPSLCADVFGFQPGEVLETVQCRIGGHGAAVVGQLVVVIGARGGRLYVLRYGESSASAWSTPPTPGNDVRGAILQHHGAHLVFHPSRSLTPAEEAEIQKPHGVLMLLLDAVADASAQVSAWQERRQQELAARVAQVRADAATLKARASAEAERVYNAEQRAFLQRAPDLYIAVLGHSALCHSGSAEDQAETSSMDAAEGYCGATTATTVPVSSPPSPSVYAAVARGDAAARAVILLSPRVVLTSGTVGWAGEGDVMLNASQAGLLEDVEGSLSASVVM
ncbi:hypothetical protein NQL31_000988 [Lotmaria passim]